LAQPSERTTAPASRTAFFGRERERARLSELVRRCPLATVTGVGGVGKTRLTAEVLATEADAGLVRWCLLSALDDEDSVAAAVASALGRDSASVGPEQAVVDAINERQFLVVLDNCEHVVRSVADLAERVLADCPEARLVATSREPLGVEGEAVLALGPLDVPDPGAPAEATSDAVALFLDRARLVRWDFQVDDGNAAAIARICRRLDGLPLALELAAARVRSLSPAEIAEHLDSRFALLARPRARGSERHRTLRAAIDWSYRLLEEPERLVFERLSVFASGADLEAAVAVCDGEGVDADEVLDLLDRLAERSLLRVGDQGARTTYGMLESLRHYAGERLVERGEERRARERHADHYAGMSDRLRRAVERTWSAPMLRQGTETFEEVRAAVHWSTRGHPNRERALRLVAPMWALAHSDHSTEIADLCDEVLAAWPTEHDELGQALLGTAAVAGFVCGRPEAAMERARSAIEAEAGGAPAAVVARRAVALVTYGFRADVDGGLDRLDEVIGAARGRDMTAIALEMAVLRAQALAAAGRLEEALRKAEALRAEAQQLESPYMSLWSDYVLGTIMLAAGDDRAEGCFAESLRRGREAGGFSLTRGLALRQLGALAVRQGRTAKAAGRLADAYEHFAQSGDSSQTWDVLRTAASLFARCGRRDLAAQAIAGAAADPRARRPAPLEAAGLEELRAELGADVERAEAAPPRLEELGPALAAALREVAAAQPAPAAPPGPAQTAVFRREGELWTLSFEAQSVHLPDLKGLHDLARLLEAPGQELHCLELAGAAGIPQGDAGELLDEQGRAAYRRRMRELEEEAARAEAAGDDARAEAAREELDTLTDTVAAAFGLGGRPRKSGHPAERARSAVTWRIRSALSKIEEAHPALGRHLRNSVRTGTFCSYRPERGVEWLT
jgi:predicted ATPase